MRFNEILLEDQESWKRVLTRLSRVPQFKTWWRKSVVRDENTGLAEVCYHWGRGDWREPKPFTHFGTISAAEMRFLDVSDFRRQQERPLENHHTTPFLLSIQKPYWISDLGRHNLVDYVEELKLGTWEQNHPLLSDQEGEAILARGDAGWDELAKLVTAKGFDGFGYYNEHEGDESWIILHPSQARPVLELFSLLR